MSKVREKKEAYWRRQFSQYKSSGTSVVDFCRRRRIPVRLAVFSEGPIEVVHPGGCVVRVPAGFDTDSLRRVLDTLSAPRSMET